MRFAQRFGSLLVLALACYSRPRGHGELAVIADSILPRSSPQVCVTVPADSGRPYPTGYTRCTREPRSEEHTSELQSQSNLVCRLLLEKKNNSRTPAHLSRELL